MNLQFIQRLYAATPLSERKVGEHGSDLDARYAARPQRKVRKRRPWLPFSVVEEARRLHEQQGLAPMQISRKLAEQGFDVPNDTVSDWVRYKTRCDG